MAKQAVIHPWALLVRDYRPPALVWAEDPSLPRSNETRYICPQGHRMKLRRGKVLQWHFSHMAAEINCTGEGDIHRAFKYGLARHIEQTLDPSRHQIWIEYRWDQGQGSADRVPDIMVATWDAQARMNWVTIEIQHSPIDVEVVKRRVNYDVHHKPKWSPAWVFTSNVVHLPENIHHGLLIKSLRVPNAAAWLINECGVGLSVIDINTGRLWHLTNMRQDNRNKGTDKPKYFDMLVSAGTSQLAVLPKRLVRGSTRHYQVATFVPQLLSPRMAACAEEGTLKLLSPTPDTSLADKTA